MRWKYVIPLVAFSALFSLAVWLFLDPVARWAMVKTGEGIFGARVNIASVKASLLHTSLRVRGVQIADKSSPMKNLVQFDEAAFHADFLPLLQKKVIIREASLTGLRFGTPRKTSGALSRVEKQPGIVGKAAEKMWSRVETFSLDKFEGVKKYYDPKTVINKDQLESLKVADAAKTRLQQMPNDFQKQLDQLALQKRSDDLRRKVDDLSKGSGSSGVLGVAEKLQQAQSVQKDLQSLKSDIDKARQDVTGRVTEATGLVSQVQSAREADWARLRKKLQLPSFDTASMASLVFGPAVVTNGERALGWVQTARRYMPAKDNPPPPPPRGKGRTIEFPRTHDLPRFLLVKCLISGDVGQDRPFAFSGELDGLTSNPSLYGKPTLLTLHGAQGGRSFGLEVTIDHTRDVAREALKGNYSGFPISGMSFGQANSLALLLKQGTADASGEITFAGDSLQGHLDARGQNLAVEPHIAATSSSAIAQRLTQSLTSSLSHLSNLTLGVNVSGTLASPDLRIESNIGGVISDAMKNAFGAEIAQQEKALQDELNRLVQDRIKELDGLTSKFKDQALSQLGSNNKVVDDLLAQLKKQLSGSALPGPAGNPLDSIKGLFGR